MSNITDAVLATTLKELLQAGMIARKAYEEIPPHVEYSLTRAALRYPFSRKSANGRAYFIKEQLRHPLTQCERCDYKSPE